MKAVIVWNNAGVRSTCPVCGYTHKPGIGPWPFASENGLPDYGGPICLDCGYEIEPLHPDIKEAVENELREAQEYWA